MIPWLVGHGKSIAHSAWSFAFVTKNPTKVQKCNFFAFGRPWKFPWPTPWKFPGPGNFHGLNLLLPMEISRAWKFPWHGKFQALTPTYPCRIFLVENILQWIYLCSAICCCLFEIFTGKKTKGGLVKDQTLSNIFFGNLPVYILIFASIIFILVRKKNIVWRVYLILLEYNGESRTDKWRNSGMAEKLVIRKVFWIKFGSSQDISLFCWWLKNVCVLEGNGQNKNGKMWGKFPLCERPLLPLVGTPMSKNLKFILCFRALGAFLVFTKMLTFCDKVKWD